MSLPEPQGDIPPDLGSGGNSHHYYVRHSDRRCASYCFSSHGGSGATPTPQLRIGMYADRQTSVPSPAPRLRRLSSPETSGSDIRKAQGQARQTQRAPRPSKNRVFGLLGHTTGQTSDSNPAFLKKFHEVPRQETAGVD
jgi:hypothetical protein